MKKLIFFLFAITVSVQNVYATSGCCSSHDGVDCSKIQANGKVVCNDGNVGSSCLYSNQTQCSVTPTVIGSESEEIINEQKEVASESISSVIKETSSSSSSYPTIKKETRSSNNNYSSIEINNTSSSDDQSKIENIVSSSTEVVSSSLYSSETLDEESSSEEELATAETIISGAIVYGSLGYLGYRLYKKKHNKNTKLK